MAKKMSYRAAQKACGRKHLTKGKYKKCVRAKARKAKKSRKGHRRHRRSYRSPAQRRASWERRIRAAYKRRDAATSRGVTLFGPGF